MSMNPKQRPNMNAVLNHPWMKGYTKTDAEIQQEFDERTHSTNKFNSDEAGRRNATRQREHETRKTARGDGDNLALMNIFNEYQINDDHIDEMQGRQLT